MLRVTLVPTEASASRKENVIPSVAQVLVDCRVPPGMGSSQALEVARALLGADGQGLEFEFTDEVVGNRSRVDSPLARAIEGWLADADPGAVLVPIVMPGFSDSHWFRRAFDSAVVYGFCPQRELALPEAMPLVHGADERAAVADVEFSTRFYLDIIQAVLG
jgi:acetylornithine deacetylase/succinyl-diaminopimelate desuccinylase-like protein